MCVCVCVSECAGQPRPLAIATKPASVLMCSSNLFFVTVVTIFESNE